MKTRAYWLSRAVEMRAIVMRLTAVRSNTSFPFGVRYHAAVELEAAEDAAVRFELNALSAESPDA